MVRMLGRRTQKGQFEDLYPNMHPLSPMHVRSLELSAKLTDEQAFLSRLPAVAQGQYVVNRDFEARFGKFLRMAMQLQNEHLAR